MRKTLSILILSLVSASALASVKDYQVKRLIMMKSDCVEQSLARTETESGGLMFVAQCKNLSHYPDGVKVLCDDPEDERSCKLQTKAKSYDHLRLLQQN